MSPKDAQREMKSLAARYPKRGIDATIPEDIRNQLVSKEQEEAANKGMKVHEARKLAKGGKVDGCAQRGKTRGKVV